MKDLITAEELEEKILVDDSLNKINSIISRFMADIETRNYLYFRKGLTQEIFEEIIPLVRYGMYKYSCMDTYLKYYSGSSRSFDGEFVNNKNELIERVEVTFAVDGYTVQLQRECATEHGWAPLVRRPIVSGNSKNRMIPEPDVELDGSDYVIENIATLIQTAFENKNKNINKYPNMTLLIAVDLPLLLPFEVDSIFERLSIENSGFNCVYVTDVRYNICRQIG